VAADDLLAHITPEQRVEGDPTPGMQREQAVSSEGMWAGVALTEPGMTSGWHHHGDHETTIYVVAGWLRMEAGPGGRQVIDAAPGDFVYVPPGAVHREGNPSEGRSQLVVIRAGRGPTTVNVDGPAPESSATA
jgi:uncharacterized RmlC-like cupin family protein